MKKTFKCRKGKNREAVAVAADALWQLQTGRVRVSHFYLHGKAMLDIYRDELLSSTKQTCHACAIGALMLARLRRFDAGWIQSNADQRSIAPDDKGSICQQLASIFPKSTLDVIETVYERYRPVGGEFKFAQFEKLACGTNIRDHADRELDEAVMSAIFRNIIANHGDFKPATGVHPEIGVKLGKSRKVLVVRKPLRKRRTVTKR